MIGPKPNPLRSVDGGDQVVYAEKWMISDMVSHVRKDSDGHTYLYFKDVDAACQAYQFQFIRLSANHNPTLTPTLILFL